MFPAVFHPSIFPGRASPKGSMVTPRNPSITFSTGLRRTSKQEKLMSGRILAFLLASSASRSSSAFFSASSRFSSSFFFFSSAFLAASSAFFLSASSLAIRSSSFLLAYSSLDRSGAERERGGQSDVCRLLGCHGNDTY